MPKSYKCYGCDDIKKYDQLRYECKCIHEEEPTGRGVCKECFENKKPCLVPAGHNLAWIHDLLPDVIARFELIEKNAPGWVSMQTDGNSEIYRYYMGPNGEIGEDLAEKYPNYIFYPQLRTSLTKTFQIEKFEGEMCSCCS